MGEYYVLGRLQGHVYKGTEKSCRVETCWFVSRMLFVSHLSTCFRRVPETWLRGKRCLRTRVPSVRLEGINSCLFSPLKTKQTVRVFARQNQIGAGPSAMWNPPQGLVSFSWIHGGLMMLLYYLEFISLIASDGALHFPRDDLLSEFSGG